MSSLTPKNAARLSPVQALKHAVFRRYRARETRLHRLRYLFWECTLRCNLQCRHCGSDCLATSGVSDMPLSDFLRVLDDIRGHGIQRLMVCITGGEPLLRPDLEAAGRAVCKRGFRWGIVTNGLLLTSGRFISLLNSGMTSLSISMDGLPEQHNWLRKNPRAFAAAENAVALAVAFRRQFPKKLAFDVITCVHRGNLATLRDFRYRLISLGVTDWRIFSIFPEGRAKEHDLALGAAEYRELMAFIAETRRYRTKAGGRIHVNYSCEGYLGGYELRVRDYFYFCRAGINVGSVMCDGSISACLSVRAADFIQGNIYGDSFMDVWSTRYQTMRERAWAKTGACARCKHWRACLGNGLHLHADAHSQSAHCNLALLTEDGRAQP